MSLAPPPPSPSSSALSSSGGTPRAASPFSPIDDCIADLRAGKMVILTDDEDRENEGDLILPAQFVTPESINFMLSIARGYLCLSLTEKDCDRLDLGPQAAQNTSVRGTPFTVSIDGHPKHGFTTGVSARERANTIRLAIDPSSTPDDFVRPGHINPLRSRDGGVLVRTGQTEGSLDLCRLAGLYPAAAIIEIMREDGEMARVPDLEVLARKHNLRMCSVAQIIEHRLARESLVTRLDPREGTMLRTALGEFRLIAFQSVVDPLPHLALCVGDVGTLDPATGGPREIREATLVRVHRRHLLGDVFLDLDSSRSGASATGQSLQRAMSVMQDEARAGRGGAIVYLRPTAPPDQAAWGTSELEQRLQTPTASLHPHAATFAAHSASVGGAGGGAGADAPKPDVIPALMRDFGVGGQILRQLGLTDLRLLTNSNAEMPGLEAFGLRIVSRERL